MLPADFLLCFPEGIKLGTIEKISKEGGANFYTITVELFLDFNSLAFVEVIENKKKKELDLIMKNSGSDDGMD